jgi:multiple sugar transport system permease protein
MYGIQPGPLLFQNRPDLVWGLIDSMYVGNVMLLILNLPLIGIFVRLLYIPSGILYPLIVTISVIGAYAINGSVTDLYLILLFGIIGYTFDRVDIPVAPLVLSLVLGAPAGYAIARYPFRGRDAFRLAILSTRAFPIVILSIPLAVTFIGWGIYDTIWAVALMHTALALPFAVLITASIFVSVPRELEEAAQTLGSTPVGAFVKVVLPLALPGLAAAALFTFVLSWNEVFAAVILTLSERTLPAHVLSVLSGSPAPFRFAAGFFLLVPSLIVIFFIRRYLLGLWGRVIK